MQLLAKILGDPNKRDLKAIQPLVDEINRFESQMKALSDTELSAKTVAFRSQLALYLKGGLVLEDELVTLLREALQGVEPLSMEYSDEQLHMAVIEFRQKLERHDPEVALKERLAQTLSEYFEQAYAKLASLLIERRVSMAMDLAKERELSLGESDSSKQIALTLLKEVEPALGGVESELQDEAFADALSHVEKSGRASETREYLQQLLTAILQHLQPEIVAIRADAMDDVASEMAKKYKTGKTLDDLLPEAFAVVREAAWRKIKMRHYDVQLIGGIVLHQGKIAEMGTGEGKTLVATSSVYLNALTGKGVHVVTVNDYLARRDAQWMGQIYTFLGLTVGVLVNAIDPQAPERRAAYQADITYGTNNEFGFDYLRDNMVTSLSQMVQRELNFAIVDEVDNILIDEARTPLIISGQGEESTDHYAKFARWAKQLNQESDYTVDEKTRAVMLTEPGIDRIERLAGIQNIYDEANMNLTRYMENAIKAQVIFKLDKDYILKDGEVIIVDEFTGRQMPGRRYSEGLHQAIEAKEGVKVQRENHTLATVTFQNYFRLYAKLAGMTGTALTESEEFHKIYELDVVVIPPNKVRIRQDLPDLIYRSQEGKFRAVVLEIKARSEKGQPVLVGTTSVEISEHLSRMLELMGIAHNVLNAKYHEHEAHIVAQAGRSGAVTIATNMAGRGTDILLGGNPDGFKERILRQHAERTDYIREMPEQTENERAEKEAAVQEYIANMTDQQQDEIFQEKIRECEEDHERVVGLGGLHIIGTERHESRRIDNQLRGRAGRQGDPGSSRFYLALDDELMRRFAADRIAGLMEKVGMEEDMPLESKLVSRFIENAQTRVEGYNFDIRKNVVEYDDVIAKQREVIFADRRAVLEHGDMHERIVGMIRNEVGKIVETSIVGPMVSEEEELETLFKMLETWVYIPEEMVPENIHAVTREQIKRQMTDLVTDHYEQRGEELRNQAHLQGAEGLDLQRDFERTYLLQTLDRLWMDHIDALDVMRAGIGFRAVGQRDPLVEFKNEAFFLFDQLKAAIQHYTVDALLKLLRDQVTLTVQRPEPQHKIPQNLHTNADELAKLSGQAKSDASNERTKAVQSRKSGTTGGHRRPHTSTGRHNTITASHPHTNSGKQNPTTASHANGIAKVGRNDPCPCGSGKKYKKCHGA
jgi:preprotein translocase subunit SecA